MNKNLIISKVERFYKQYLEQGSGIMLNANTDYFFDNLLSIPYCKHIFDYLVSHNSVPAQLIEERQEKCYLEFFEDMTKHGQEYYIAYCIQLYLYLRNHNGKISNPYCYETVWIDSFGSEHGNRFQLFKTDFIRPIVDYIINSITNEAIILYYLDRYKTRLERFKTIHFTDKTREWDLQKDIALYLFDNSLEFHRELDLGNGKLDFLIELDNKEHYGTVLDCNDKPYIVEVKYFKEKLQEHDIKKAIRQLSAYMRVQNAYGCLMAYIMDANKKPLRNYEIEEIEIIPIYVGEESATNQ